ncbi:hypothetical protein Dvar_08010 [Desulfosarcina variabilis str. Montpellier]|uniref:hypothetical protein n=1 Tax=Desulfosarcina variabilis TaxID=2300 RepID=UPI003AFABF83
MKNDSYRDSEPAASPGELCTWRESNCALAQLLARHRHALKGAIATAETIGRSIDELTPLMVALCRRTCRFCPEPCCITNTVWFDFQDLLFFHLTGAPIPDCQAVSEPKEACPFLGHHGCSQPPRNRPWMCIQYLCPAQRTILERQQRTVWIGLMDKIEFIKRQRRLMETDITRCIKSTHRIKAKR